MVVFLMNKETKHRPVEDGNVDLQVKTTRNKKEKAVELEPRSQQLAKLTGPVGFCSFEDGVVRGAL